MTSNHGTQFSEWDLLNAIVQFHNSQDMPGLMVVLLDERSVFEDKPRCLEVALNSILLTQESVAQYTEQLTVFVDKIKNCEIQSLIAAFRLGILEQLLNKDEQNSENTQMDNL